MAIGKKTGGKPFPKGHKLAKGGKRPGAGRPTKVALVAKKAKLEIQEKELAIAKDIWADEIAKKHRELARRYVERALLNDAMLRDLRRTVLPNAQKDKDTQDKPQVHYHYLDANKVRDRARLEEKRKESPQD